MAIPGILIFSSPPEAMARSGIMGDLNGDGQVNFQDLGLLMANWQGSAPQNFGLATITPYIVSIHQRAVDHVEDQGCIVVINLDADEVAILAGALDKRRGIRTLTRPAGWPEWPPPGSALEELMERATTDEASVEALAQAMLDLLPSRPEAPAGSTQFRTPAPIDSYVAANGADSPPLPEDMPEHPEAEPAPSDPPPPPPTP